MAEREKQALKYLKKHKILELFDNITAALVFERPDDPKEFIVEYITKLKEARSLQVNYPMLFDTNNVKSLYGMLDTVGTGYINHAQYMDAMANVGAKRFDTKPEGAKENKISYDTFTQEVEKGLRNASATFAG